jgi:hypothetical protein
VNEDKYPAGSRWRGVREGASLWGMRPVAPYVQQGWRQELHVGDVITSTGISMTGGDGVPHLKWAGADGEWLANDCVFEPGAGFFSVQAGYLEAIT